jgi:hypothetical protein
LKVQDQGLILIKEAEQEINQRKARKSLIQRKLEAIKRGFKNIFLACQINLLNKELRK